MLMTREVDYVFVACESLLINTMSKNKPTVVLNPAAKYGTVRNPS